MDHGTTREYVLGIDLGTTFTAAAVCDPAAEPRMLSLGSNSYAVPSVVFLREDGTFLAGEAAELQSSSDPTRVARHFKRRLGDDIPIRLAGTAFRAEELAAELLRWVHDVAVERSGSAPSRVVLTHPANWGSFRTEVLEQAAATAGIMAPVLVAEPEAAAVHYVQSERLGEGNLLGVYDLGGGTFDAVVMRRKEPGFELVGRPVGIERLGGVDFDEAIRDFVLEAVDLDDIEASEEAVSAAYALQESCVAAKRVLSADTVAQVRVAFPGVTQTVRINRAEFEKRIRPRLSETLDAFETAVQSAGVSVDDLDRILLVGGSSRIPLVAALLAQRFGRPLAVDTDPKNTVALGAAVYGLTAPQEAAPQVLEHPPQAASMAAAVPPTVQPEPVPVEQPVQPPQQPLQPERAPQPVAQAEPVTQAEPLPVAQQEPVTQAEPVPQRESPQPTDQTDLLGVQAESGHRARIPQPSVKSAAAPEPEGAPVEAVAGNSMMMAVVLVLVVLVVVAVITAGMVLR